MLRQARTTSAARVYHVILCGVNMLCHPVSGTSSPTAELHLFAALEEGIGPRTLSRLTGFPYSIVQRATSDAVRYGSMVCESLPRDEEFETYINDSEYEKYPEY